MIVAMKKAAVIVRDGERAAALSKLRALGIMHLETGRAGSDALSALLERRRVLETASFLLSSLKATDTKGTVTAGTCDAKETARRVHALVEERKNLLDQEGRLDHEAKALETWGGFDPAGIAALRAHGLPLRLFEYLPKLAHALPQDVEFIPFPRFGKKLRAAVLLPESKALPEGFEELPLPALGPAALRRRIADQRTRIGEIQGELAALKASHKTLEGGLKTLDAEIEFEAARASMDSAEGGLAYLKGFLPARSAGNLLDTAKREGWAVLVTDPQPGDAIPSLVENNRIVRLIQPVFDLMAIVPGYKEYEISLWFLLFFSLFFGMIIGDAAYGLILLGLAVWQALKSRVAGKPVAPLMKLLLLLSVTTVAWGAVTGTWFSIDVASLPGFLKVLMIPAFAGDPKQAQQNIMQFCFILGTVQLCLAHVKNIRRDFPGLKFVAQIGWLMLVIGLYSLVLNMVIDKIRFPMPAWSWPLILGGFALYFVFSNQEGKFLKGLLTSLINFIPTFLGSVSCFADIISYIRLFAVGLAGVAISQTVNGMVGSMPPGVVRIAAGTLLLIFGHTLNLTLSVLSVMVHGIRLNMLEFSGHLGMEWSGTKYKPFSEQAKS